MLYFGKKEPQNQEVIVVSPSGLTTGVSLDYFLTSNSLDFDE